MAPSVPCPRQPIPARAGPQRPTQQVRLGTAEPTPPTAPRSRLVDAPEARSSDGDIGAGSADDDGSCPDSHPIKANDNSNIFHVPGGRFYERTGPNAATRLLEAALADGYRQAKA